MAIQIRSNQIKLADTFDFSGSLGVVKVQDPSNADEAASKGYVDAQIPTALSAGDGIDITSDVVSVDFATDGALAFIGPQSDQLSVKLKSESGGTISKDASGLFIADAAIANAKLANSTISGKSLGANLDALTAGDGISMTSYNGSAAVSDLTVQLDGATLAKSASGLKVADNAIGSGQLANDSVTSAAVADGAINANSMIADAVITGPKLAVQPARAKFTGDGSTTAFTVTGKNTYTGGEEGLLMFRNGILVEAVQSSPSGKDQYTAANSGSDLVITFGAAPDNGDVLLFVGLLMS